MGIDHSTQRALIHGPTANGGFGVRHLYTEMMGLKLETVISQIRAGPNWDLHFLLISTTSNYMRALEHQYFYQKRTYQIFP
jgi:hypothetical protein